MVAGEKDFEPGQYEGRNIWYGVREFAMAAAMNFISFSMLSALFTPVRKLRRLMIIFQHFDPVFP